MNNNKTPTLLLGVFLLSIFYFVPPRELVLFVFNPSMACLSVEVDLSTDLKSSVAWADVVTTIENKQTNNPKKNDFFIIALLSYFNVNDLMNLCIDYNRFERAVEMCLRFLSAHLKAFPLQ